MIASGEPITCGFPLSDPGDPRFQKFIAYRRRFSNFLLGASKVLRNQGEENTVDAILMLVSCSTSFNTELSVSIGSCKPLEPICSRTVLATARIIQHSASSTRRKPALRGSIRCKSLGLDLYGCGGQGMHEVPLIMKQF